MSTTIPFLFQKLCNFPCNLVGEKKFWLLSSIIKFSYPPTNNSLHYLSELFPELPPAWLPQLYTPFHLHSPIKLSSWCHFLTYLSVTHSNTNSSKGIYGNYIENSMVIFLSATERANFFLTLLFLALVTPCTSAFLNTRNNSVHPLLVFFSYNFSMCKRLNIKTRTSS